MHFRIDNSSGRPVYRQIIDQVKRDIAIGRIVRDDRLPTVRELARQLAINPNTIAKAYRQLEREGVLTTRPGAGTFVANLDSNLSKSVKKRLLCEDLERTVVDAFHMQIDKATLLKWFDETVKRFELDTGEEK